jgi:hypothetical protein
LISANPFYKLFYEKMQLNPEKLFIQKAIPPEILIKEN